MSNEDVEDQDLEEHSNKDKIATKKKKAKCVVPWSFVLFHDCNFANFALCFIFNQVTFYIKIFNFFVWLQVLCAPTYKDMDTTIIMFSHLPIWNF